VLFIALVGGFGIVSTLAIGASAKSTSVCTATTPEQAAPPSPIFIIPVSFDSYHYWSFDYNSI
jgi:hypothetical protein